MRVNTAAIERQELQTRRGKSAETDETDVQPAESL
jgi:hypothetical protein